MSDKGNMDAPDAGHRRAPRDRRQQSQQEENQTPSQRPIKMSEFKGLHYVCYDRIGKVIIVNNLEKDENGKIQHQMNELKTRLKQLGFGAVNVRNIKSEDGLEFVNVKKDDMISLMRDASLDDYSDCYCFLCVFAGYGRDGVLEFKGNSTGQHEYLELTTLQEFFKGKETLNLKPKLFFMQAGERPADKPDDGKDHPMKTIEMKIPREADFFTYLSDLQFEPGLFLETFTEALDEHVIGKLKPLEINKFAIRMNAKLGSKLKEKENVEYAEDVKIPCITSLLTKYMHFNCKV